MALKYIIRADDACPTMNKASWQKFETLCDEYNVKPIVAVIPDNKDVEFAIEEDDPFFWQKIRTWQNKGWDIALHGLHHNLRHIGFRHLVPINNYGEFPGLSEEYQKSMIHGASAIFCENNIESSIFVAPAHGLDKVTCKVLAEMEVPWVISDGFARDIFYEHGVHWIPQQLWRFETKREGVWTICLHPNDMTSADFKSFETWLRSESGHLGRASDLVLGRRKRGFFERFAAKVYFMRRRFWYLRQRLK